jgi:polysaccharide biosynthesis protein PslF
MTIQQKSRLATQLAASEPHIRVIYVSTYTPRECGIATYSRALTKAINQLNPDYTADFVAIDDEKSGAEPRTYPWEVKYKIDQEDLRSWMNAADYINQSGAEVVNLQHEFGIYGGVEGEYVLPFIEAITKPIVVCLHTVLPHPSAKMLETVRRIAERAEAIIVMVEAAGKMLTEIYGVNPEKIVAIPHGVPDVPFGQDKLAKKRLGYNGWNIISSFGLFSRSKGYEHAIKALPAIVKKHPKTKLLLLGETHPVVVRNEGEEYRESLEKLVKELKMEEHVDFVNHYLTLDEIIQFLRITDVYITPYPNLEQVSSGTLSYALSAGLPCVSTPYVYAKDVLADGRGVVLDSLTAEDIAEKVIDLLDNPKKRQEISKKAYAYGRNMIWTRVALRHLDLFEIVAKEHGRTIAAKSVS